MTHDELVEKVARDMVEALRRASTHGSPYIVDAYDDLTSVIIDGEFDMRKVARTAIATVREALREPTPEMQTAGRNVEPLHSSMATVWLAMLAASPLPNPGKEE